MDIQYLLFLQNFRKATIGFFNGIIKLTACICRPWIRIAPCVLGIIYIQLKPYPMDYLGGNLIVDPEKMKLDAFGNSGSLLGVVLGRVLEKRFVKFSTMAPKYRRLPDSLPALFSPLFSFTAPQHFPAVPAEKYIQSFR